MLNLAGIALRGTSIAGVETCIELPGLDLCLDIGRSSRSAARLPRLAVTHGHLDHLGGIASYVATRALNHLEPPTCYVPAPLLPGLRELFETWRKLDGSRLPVNWVPVEPGDRHPLGPDRELRVLRTRHNVPSVGYAVMSRKRKLRPEFAGLPGERIRDLRLSGVEVSREVWTADLAYTGDTRLEAVLEEPSFLEARLLLMELTFLDERVSVQAARAKGHVHLDELRGHAGAFHNQAILFLHFSARYTVTELRRLLDERLPPELRSRSTALLPR